MDVFRTISVFRKGSSLEPPSGFEVKADVGEVRQLPVSDRGRDQIEVVVQLASLYYRGLISARVHELWKAHVARNRCEVDERHSSHPHFFVQGKERRTIVQPAITEFFDRNPVCVVDCLGDRVSAICFTGPHANSILVSKDSIKDDVSLTFQVLEIFMHYVIGHVRSDTFGVLIEFRRDRPVPPAYLTPRLGDFEGAARSAVSCLWSDEYSASFLTAPVNLRVALQRPGVTPELVRLATREKSCFRGGIQAFLSRSLGALAERFGGPPSFSGPVAIVKAPDNVDINVYLLQVVTSRDGSKRAICRRWIPSEAVLHRLGVSLGDVIRVPWTLLVTFPEETMLIDPKEVASIADVLATTRTYSLLNRLRGSLGGYKAHLKGVLDRVGQTSATQPGPGLAPPRRRPSLPLRFGGYRQRRA